MTIYQALVTIEDEGGKIFKCDTIHYAGEYWLVPEWLSAPELSTRMPERIIRVAAFRHQIHLGSEIADLTVTYPIPRLYFESREEIGDDMRRCPPLEFLK